MKKRIIWLDYARSFALFFIVLNHCVSRVYNIYEGQQYEFFSFSLSSNIIKAILETLSWLGVPIFLMITGALILNKNFDSKEDIKNFYKNNYLPLVLSTIAWSFIGYILLTIFYYKETLDLNWVKNLFYSLFFINKTEFGSMWYMDMIFVLYPILPIFSVYLNKFEDYGIKIPCSLVFILSFVFPTIHKILLIFNLDNISLSTSGDYLFCSYFLFCLIGYFISNGCYSFVKKKILIFTLIVTCFITVFIQILGFKADYCYITRYDSVGILIISSIIFELLRRYKFTSKNISKIANCISINAYGVYIIHIFFIQFIYKYLQMEIMIYNHLITMVIYFIISIVGSILIIACLNFSKIFRKYLLLKK